MLIHDCETYRVIQYRNSVMLQTKVPITDEDLEAMLNAIVEKALNA